MRVQRFSMSLRRAYPLASAPASHALGAFKTKRLPGLAEEPLRPLLNPISLVRALGKKGHKDHQVRKREEPLVRVEARGFRGARNEAQMAALGKIVEMLDTNPRQAGDLRIGENLLARLHGNHGPSS